MFFFFHLPASKRNSFVNVFFLNVYENETGEGEGGGGFIHVSILRGFHFNDITSFKLDSKYNTIYLLTENETNKLTLLLNLFNIIFIMFTTKQTTPPTPCLFNK